MLTASRRRIRLSFTACSAVASVTRAGTAQATRRTGWRSCLGSPTTTSTPHPCWYGSSTASSADQVGQQGGNGAKRLTTVADRILVFGRHLRGGDLVAVWSE